MNIILFFKNELERSEAKKFLEFQIVAKYLNKF